MRIYGIKKKNILVYRLLASKLVKKKKELKKLRLKLRLFNTLGKGKMFYLKSFEINYYKFPLYEFTLIFLKFKKFFEKKKADFNMILVPTYINPHKRGEEFINLKISFQLSRHIFLEDSEVTLFINSKPFLGTIKQIKSNNLRKYIFKDPKLRFSFIYNKK